MKPKYYSVNSLVVPLRSEEFRKHCLNTLYSTSFYQYQVPFVIPEAHVGYSNLNTYFEEVPLPATTLDQWLEILTTKPKFRLRGKGYRRVQLYINKTLHVSAHRAIADIIYNTLGQEAVKHSIQSLHYIALERWFEDTGHMSIENDLSPEAVAALLLFPIELAKFARFIKA